MPKINTELNPASHLLKYTQDGYPNSVALKTDSNNKLNNLTDTDYAIALLIVTNMMTLKDTKQVSLPTVYMACELYWTMVLEYKGTDFKLSQDKQIIEAATDLHANTEALATLLEYEGVIPEDLRSSGSCKKTIEAISNLNETDLADISTSYTACMRMAFQSATLEATRLQLQKLKLPLIYQNSEFDIL